MNVSVLFLGFTGLLSYSRERFETLVGKIGDLEKEKLSLIETMKNSTTPNGSSKEPGKGGGGGRGGSAEALRERLKVSRPTIFDTLPTTTAESSLAVLEPRFCVVRSYKRRSILFAFL